MLETSHVFRHVRCCGHHEYSLLDDDHRSGRDRNNDHGQMNDYDGDHSCNRPRYIHMGRNMEDKSLGNYMANNHKIFYHHQAA